MDCIDIFAQIHEVTQIYASRTFGLGNLGIFPSMYT